MVQITHVCISDLHAGALTSLITPLDDDLNWSADLGPTGSTTTFATALNDLLGTMGKGTSTSPQLIILGDALDLSLSSPYRSAEVFRGFMGALMAKGTKLAKSILFIPGNHDHSIWTGDRASSPAFFAEGSRHTTRAFPPQDHLIVSTTLQNILKDLGVSVPTYYPNFGIGSKDSDKAIVFHHGHFVEHAYKLVSVLLHKLQGISIRHQTAEQLETWNGTWIDFGWSTLGDAGDLEKDVFTAYQLLLTGGAADLLQERLAASLSAWLAAEVGIPNTKMMGQGLDLLSIGVVDSLVGKFSQLERFMYTRHLSEGSIEGLKSYLYGAVLDQMINDLDDENAGDKQTTFIFGHTHKPFVDQVVAEGFSKPVSVYNTGGWVLDTSLFSTVEGAQVVFVDADHNTAALRLFAPPENGLVPLVTVECADPGPDNDLVTALKAQVLNEAGDENTPLWAAFAQAAANGYKKRQRKILQIAETADNEALKTGGWV